MSGIVCDKPFYAHGALNFFLKTWGIQAVYADDFTSVNGMNKLIIADNVFSKMENVFY